MRHLEDIALLLKTLRESTVFHGLVIESPPGWAKSTTVERLLAEANEPYESLGSYSTPLALFTALCRSPAKTLVLDDCAGLFNDSISMSILKAATWGSVGSHGERRVAWNSTSVRAPQPNLLFSGKLILLTNALPQGRDTKAFLSRTLHYEFKLSLNDWKQILNEASSNADFFPNSELARTVVKFLIEHGEKTSRPVDINLRTLRMGYELAASVPERWQSLMERLLPQVDPIELVERLGTHLDSVESQFRAFNEATGLSQRTFFNYRKRVRNESQLLQR